jgi:hypothetical protein
MMDTKKLILLFLILTACNNNKQDAPIEKGGSQQISNQDSALRVYLYNTKSIYVDTVYKELVSIKLVDSVYQISYKNFKKKDLNNSFTENHTLPIGWNAKSENGTDIMLDKKKVKYKGKQYQIYKTFYDEIHGSDEETLYFLEPTVGIIIEKSVAWGNYLKLIDTGNEEKNKIVHHLSEAILQDSLFFNEIKE